MLLSRNQVIHECLEQLEFLPTTISKCVNAQYLVFQTNDICTIAQYILYMIKVNGNDSRPSSSVIVHSRQIYHNAQVYILVSLIGLQIFERYHINDIQKLFHELFAL